MEKRNKIKENGCLIILIWSIVMFFVIPFAYDFDNVPISVVIIGLLVMLFFAYKMS